MVGMWSVGGDDDDEECEYEQGFFKEEKKT